MLKTAICLLIFTVFFLKKSIFNKMNNLIWEDALQKYFFVTKLSTGLKPYPWAISYWHISVSSSSNYSQLNKALSLQAIFSFDLFCFFKLFFFLHIFFLHLHSQYFLRNLNTFFSMACLKDLLSHAREP